MFSLMSPQDIPVCAWSSAYAYVPQYCKELDFLQLPRLGIPRLKYNHNRTRCLARWGIPCLKYRLNRTRYLPQLGILV